MRQANHPTLSLGEWPQCEPGPHVGPTWPLERNMWIWAEENSWPVGFYLNPTPNSSPPHARTSPQWHFRKLPPQPPMAAVLDSLAAPRAVTVAVAGQVRRTMPSTGPSGGRIGLRIDRGFRKLALASAPAAVAGRCGGTGRRGVFCEAKKAATEGEIYAGLWESSLLCSDWGRMLEELTVELWLFGVKIIVKWSSDFFVTSKFASFNHRCANFACVCLVVIVWWGHCIWQLFVKFEKMAVDVQLFVNWIVAILSFWIVMWMFYLCMVLPLLVPSISLYLFFFF